MYCLVLNLRSCVIFESVVVLLFQKSLESLSSISSLLIQLSMYGFFFAISFCCFNFLFSRYF
jgi:hypothetical protein